MLLVLLGSVAGASAQPAGSVNRIAEGVSAQPLRADVLEDPGGRLDLAAIRARDTEFRPLAGASIAQSKSA